MTYYIFKSPRKKGDRHLETLRYEPNDFIVQQKAVKYGPIIIISETELQEILKKEENNGR